MSENQRFLLYQVFALPEQCLLISTIDFENLIYVEKNCEKI